MLSMDIYIYIYTRTYNFTNIGALSLTISIFISGDISRVARSQNCVSQNGAQRAELFANWCSHRRTERSKLPVELNVTYDRDRRPCRIWPDPEPTGLRFNLLVTFHVLLTVHIGTALGKWPTWCTITLYKTFIIVILYMFRTTLCSSSGGRTVLIQHLV